MHSQIVPRNFTTFSLLLNELCKGASTAVELISPVVILSTLLILDILVENVVHRNIMDDTLRFCQSTNGKNGMHITYIFTQLL